VSRGAAAITLAPLPEIEAAPRAEASGPPAGSTLVLSGIKLRRRPPAPLSVFINMPAGTPPRLHNPYYVGTLNLFNFDLGAGSPMSHGGDEEMPDMPEHQMPGGVARFDVGAVLRRQLADGLWNDGPITVTISTSGADAGSAPATYVTIDSIKLTP
jgi:tyrosinase